MGRLAGVGTEPRAPVGVLAFEGYHAIFVAIVCLLAIRWWLEFRMNASSNTGRDEGDTDKTSLALDRTVLANERTYAAWIRTGLAALVTGLGIARFMGEAMPPWSVRLITAFLILFSAQAFIIASWRYGNLGPNMTRLDVKMLPLPLVRLLSLALAGCSLFSLIGLWYMGI